MFGERASGDSEALPRSSPRHRRFSLGTRSLRAPTEPLELQVSSGLFFFFWKGHIFILVHQGSVEKRRLSMRDLC